MSETKSNIFIIKVSFLVRFWENEQILGKMTKDNGLKINSRLDTYKSSPLSLSINNRTVL